jgi:hypothetical protein
LIAKKHPDMEPLSQHNNRLLLAARKMAVMAIVALALVRWTPLPIFAAVLFSPALFCFIDGYRVLRMKGELAKRGIHIKGKDQVLYTLLNWTSNILESYYLLKGAVVYR